jgi:hypothetical protein
VGTGEGVGVAVGVADDASVVVEVGDGEPPRSGPSRVQPASTVRSVAATIRFRVTTRRC